MARIMAKLASTLTLTTYVATVLATVGSTFVWLHQHNTKASFIAFTMLAASVSNLAFQFTEWVFFSLVASGLLYAVIDEELAFAIASKDDTEHPSYLWGHMFLLVGVLASFLSNPINWRAFNPFQKRLLIPYVLGLMLIAGSLATWRGWDPMPQAQATWVGILYLISFTAEFGEGLDLALFGATQCIVFCSPFGLENIDPWAKNGMGIIIAACIGIVAHFCWLVDRTAGNRKSFKQVLAIGAVISCLAGLLMIGLETSQISYKQGYLAALMGAAAALNFIVDYFGLQAFSFVAYIFVFSSIDDVVSHIMDAFTASEPSSVLQVGWILASLGLMLSFIVFPVTIQMPKFKDHVMFATLLMGTIIIAGSVMIWNSRHYLVQAAFMALFYMTSGVFDYQPGQDLAFYSAVVLIPFYDPFQCSEEGCEIGLCIIFGTLVAMIVWHCMKNTPGPRYQPIVERPQSINTGGLVSLDQGTFYV